MSSRKKEDERNEKIIRGLLKLPANKRCINCNNLGPQYVCTNFWTFICTNCSGLHREFCHRVKSISMAKFTAQEVSALQEGGNERAREIYFKDWDPQRNSLPDSSNIDRLRDFIKHVYVDRRFSGGERTTDRSSRGKADMSDSNDNRGDTFRGSPRSPPYDDQFDERLGVGGRTGDRNIRYVYGERSPGYDQGDYKRSPRRFEVVDDRVRDDRYGNGNQFRRFEDRRLPDALPKPDGSSPSRQKDVVSSPPMMRPVRDILGADVPQLHVIDTTKSSNTKIPDSSAQTPTASSSSSVGSGDGNSVQPKKVDLGSLIDFSDDPEPPVNRLPKQSIPQQNTSPPSNGGDWAAFDIAAPHTSSQATASSGTLDSGLTQLSAFPIPSDPYPTAKDGGQQPTTEKHQASLFPADPSAPANQPLNTPITGAQQWGSSGTQGPFPNSAGNLPQVPGRQPPELVPRGSSSPFVEAKAAGRKELPADLFAALYPSAQVSMPGGWQRGPHPGMGYRMQYPMGMHQPMSTFPHPSRYANPFDFGSEPSLTHAPTFPSMGSLQGALPNVPEPSPLLRSSSFGTPAQWGPGQQPTLSPALSQGQYMMQQVPGSMQQLPHSNMAMMGHQGVGGPGSQGAMYGMGTHTASRYSLPNTPSSHSSGGGNPFG